MRLNLEDLRIIEEEVQDIAKVKIVPLFNLNLEAKEAVSNHESRHNIVLHISLKEDGKKYRREIKVDINTSLKNKLKQKCCVYSSRTEFDDDEDMLTHDVCIGYTCEMKEFFASNEAYLECEICFNLPPPNNCVHI